MIIKTLELENFRNYDTLSIEFDDHTNILYGDNAQGKTNILESIFISGTTKSHKGSKDNEIVHFGKNEAFIRSGFIKNGVDYKVNMQLRVAKRKAISINGANIKKAAELLGLVNIVFFSPEDLSIIKNGPAERRRFIDFELSQLDKTYLYNLSNYTKIVNQRNKLLKSMDYNSNLQDTIDVWDEQLIFYGKEVIKRRKEFIDDLNPIIDVVHKKLTGKNDDLFVIYHCDSSEMEYEGKLRMSKDRDLKYKTTSVGPHRDDLGFYINQVDVRKFGSQGQQRTIALALKLSEIEFVKNVINDTPILLLDDVLSELDSSRQNFLLNSIGDIQTIITCTGIDDFIKNRFEINKCFQVRNGSVEVKGSELL